MDNINLSIGLIQSKELTQVQLKKLDNVQKLLTELKEDIKKKTIKEL